MSHLVVHNYVHRSRRVARDAKVPEAVLQNKKTGERTTIRLTSMRPDASHYDITNWLAIQYPDCHVVAIIKDSGRDTSVVLLKPAREMTLKEIERELAGAVGNPFRFPGGRVRYEALRTAWHEKKMRGEDSTGGRMGEPVPLTKKPANEMTVAEIESELKTVLEGSMRYRSLRTARAEKKARGEDHRGCGCQKCRQRARDASSVMSVKSDMYDKLEVGKTYRFDGRKGKILEKLESSGQISAAGWSMGGDPMIRVEWKE
jgi:hypothetical protein